MFVSSIPVASINKKINQRISDVITKNFKSLSIEFFHTKKECIDFLIYETPDFVILNFCDRSKSKFELIKAINKDKWLNCSGIIILHQEREDELLQKLGNSNVISLIHQKDMEKKLPLILKILYANRNILFQRELHSSLVGEIAGQFTIENDLMAAQVYVNLLVNFITNLNLVDEEGKRSLKLIVQELVVNAIEHGNVGISFEDKTRFMMEGKNISEAIQEVVEANPKINEKKVLLTYKISDHKTFISIQDEGEGFNWQERMDVEKQKEEREEYLLHGRGIMMSQTVCENLTYNTRGNKVSFIFRHKENPEKTFPAIFEENSVTHWEPGQVVFRKGEFSNFLYYIAEGEFDITNEDGDTLATLRPSDVFIGEMSFLLNNQRTATVVCRQKAVLYKINRNKFIQAIQESPYYSFFLCKLLARRLETSNVRYREKQ